MANDELQAELKEWGELCQNYPGYEDTIRNALPTGGQTGQCVGGELWITCPFPVNFGSLDDPPSWEEPCHLSGKIVLMILEAVAERVIEEYCEVRESPFFLEHYPNRKKGNRPAIWRVLSPRPVCLVVSGNTKGKALRKALQWLQEQQQATNVERTKI